MKSNDCVKKLFVSDKSFILIKRLYKVVYECLEVRLNIKAPYFKISLKAIDILARCRAKRRAG